MKSKILALSKNEEFKKLLQQKKVSNKYITIFFGHLNNKNKNRLNISFVTKKKIGNAVKRNKIKRRLRNIMNDASKKISINLHYSYLVIAKPTMLNNEFKIIKDNLFQEFSKINK
jgi:ribonuclease P protein component